MKERQIVTAAEMKELDTLTIKHKEISSLELMIYAGKIMTKYICRNGLCNTNEKLLIVAGTGNNGGDALVIATEMINKGFTPSIVIVGPLSKQTEESKSVWDMIIDSEVNIHRISSMENIKDYRYLFNEPTIIIDGLFGIGLSKEVTGYHKEVINLINRSYAKVISIDIPSGLNADNGLISGVAVKADTTLVIQNYKQGNLLNDAVDYTGELHLLDIGILQVYFPTRQNLLHLSYLRNKIPKRFNNTHKYHYGFVLTLGGSKGMMGAPLMSAYAALRTGSGLSKVVYNEKYLPYISNPFPTVMVDTYHDISDYNLNKISCVIFGPGLGKNDDYNVDILKRLLQEEVPLIIDADGVFYLKQILEENKFYDNIIVTPHYGEMALLLNKTTKEIETDPLKSAKEIAKKYGITIVLKGPTTIITNYEETYFSKNGNPGMATAGSGDVLCGIIGSLLGRDYTPLEASKLGVLIHSKAACLAVEKFGEESMIATDIIDYIHKAIKG